MSKVFQHMLDTLDSLPRNSPIIAQTARLLQVLIKLETDADREKLVSLAEGIANKKSVIIEQGGIIK